MLRKENAPAMEDMPELAETHADALKRLESKGYTEQFLATEEGLKAASNGKVYRPEDLVIEEVCRFEGISNPDDESALFALHAKSDDLKGTYSIYYGPQLEPNDAEMVRRLGDVGTNSHQPKPDKHS